MRFAELRNGVISVGELCSAAGIDPGLAIKTLKRLQKLGVASPRWQEIRKNIWEFPDYMHLPIAQTLQLAQSNGGRISVKDILAQGHSLDVAVQTLDTLAEKGLAMQDPAAPERTVILQKS
jgi:hypothetical protein